MPEPKARSARSPTRRRTAVAATFDTNVLGVILSMKHEVRVMREQGSGSIVNVSSTYGHEGAAGASVYVGSKHAVEGITKSVALEIAKSGIRVNAVAPGPTDTGMLTRFTGTPENKADLVTSVPMARLGLSGRTRQRDRLHRIGRGVIHHRPRPQRRRRPLRQLSAKDRSP